MPTCFVIQPFDGGKFDKRFYDVYKPAIESAGLEPYRVDQDPHVAVPIKAIEDGIRSAAICIADITEDNPNVWYELGFTFASGTPVVMVCAEGRTGKKYPFDIQHRSIIIYKEDSTSDFENLRRKIAERIRALIQKGATLRTIAESEQTAPFQGLSHAEITILAIIAGNTSIPGSNESVYNVQVEAERTGLTKFSFALGLRRLLSKTFVLTKEEVAWDGSNYQAIEMTVQGWSWIEANESLFLVQRSQKQENGLTDVPF